MKKAGFCISVLAVMVFTASCGRQSAPTEQAQNQPAAAPQESPPAAPPPAAAPAPAPAEAAGKTTEQPKSAGPPAGGQTPLTPEAAPARAKAERAAPPPPPPPPKPKTAQLSAGTMIVIRTIDAISTQSAKTGGTFSASLEEPIVSASGWLIAPKGAPVQGRVTDSDPGGRVSGKARISIQLAGIRASDGQSIAITTDPVMQEAKSTKGRDVKRGAVTTGVGAAIGAIAGGGKGAAIGAGVGAGAGVGVAAATRGDPAVIPSETVLKFQLLNPVTVTERLKGGTNE